MKTFIRWQGNKSRYLKDILQFVPSAFSTYIEPFVGSGAMFLHLQPDKWIINDINRDLIELWNIVQSNPRYVISRLNYYGNQLQDLTYEDKLVFCKKKTKEIPSKPYGPLRATLWLVMIFCAYMGYIVNNGKYYFNGLEGKLYYKKEVYFVKDEYFEVIRNVSSYLNSTTGHIMNNDYKQVLKMANKGDFVFLDPPYLEDYNYKFNYNPSEVINHAFILELLDECKKLDKRGVKWMMTQADTSQIKGLFKDKFQVYRMRLKKYKNELVIRNYS